MAVALTGDAATQEETFDVPVIARGTLLEWVGTGGQGRRQGQPDAGQSRDRAHRSALGVLTLTG